MSEVNKKKGKEGQLLKPDAAPRGDSSYVTPDLRARVKIVKIIKNVIYLSIISVP